MSEITVESTGIFFQPDSKRVLVRPFVPADIGLIDHVITRALSLSEAEVEAELTFLRQEFQARHIDLEACWRKHFALVRAQVSNPELSHNRQLYIGALFSGEYALESAALFNPSIIPHPDQTALQPGELRFILSLRATGEGHISSIEFRSGILHADSSITMDLISPGVIGPQRIDNPTYLKSTFLYKLQEMGFANTWSQLIMEPLEEKFTYENLEHSIRTVAEQSEGESGEIERTMECIHWLADSNYEVHFHPGVSLSQRILFPVSTNESRGIEDARFVRFTEETGEVSYYATYTAYNGLAILPQLLETQDFLNFRVRTLNGTAMKNKGMAIFPRRIGGDFCMLSRHDDENLYLMRSDNLHFWNEAVFLCGPHYPWEYLKIGNCGSPIETSAGWLVLTHGVGPMRRYCIGAMLLDLQDPSQIIGRLEQPLIEPTGDHREGYVPNVVYSCGGLLHGEQLILPYALSDTASTIGTVAIAELLSKLTV